MFEAKNTDDVFMRKLIVGLASFFYDSVQIVVTEDKQTKTKKVPIFYSMTGEQQFLIDYYLDTDKYCKELRPITGNITTLPSGIFKVGDGGISNENTGSEYVRTVYTKKFESELSDEERDMTARGRFIPMEFTWTVEIKCSTDLDRMKIFQTVTRKFFKVRKFFINFEGFERLPVLISFPDKYGMEKNFKFKYPADEKRPVLQFNIETLAFMPDVDFTTEVFRGEKINQFTINTTTSK